MRCGSILTKERFADARHVAAVAVRLADSAHYIALGAPRTGVENDGVLGHTIFLQSGNSKKKGDKLVGWSPLALNIKMVRACAKCWHVSAYTLGKL